MRLVETADVFVENYRAGAMADIGLDYDSLCAIKPDLVYCSLTGYGQQGPLSDRTAYDNVVQAYSGLMAATGHDASEPVKVGPPVLDYGSGIQAAYAIASALYQRSRTGKGQYIDIAERAGLVSAIDNMLLFRCVQLIRRSQERNYDTAFYCNISAQTLADTAFFSDFTDFVVENPDLAPKLYFEFAQAVIDGAPAESIANLARLAELGFRFSLDQVMQKLTPAGG